MQQEVAKLAATPIEYPPMQSPASFNLEAVKAKVDEAIRNHEAQQHQRDDPGGRAGALAPALPPRPPQEIDESLDA